MSFLSSIWEFLRDAAIFLAAVGLAKWAWDQHRNAEKAHDREAHRDMSHDRFQADVLTRLSAIGSAIETMNDKAAEREAVANLKAHIHQIMQASNEHYLSFTEICQHLDTGSGQPTATTYAPLVIRQAVIDLVADGILDQMEDDRYFIAGDYELDQDEPEA